MVSSTSEYPYKLKQWRDYVAREAWNIQAKRVAEVGVFKGAVSHRLWHLKCVEEVFCIDPWSRQANDITYKGVSHLEKFEGKEMVDSSQERLDRIYLEFVLTASPKARVIREVSEVVAPLIPDNFFDFVFIDAIHFYEFVKRDIELWLPKVKEGGILAGDDYGLEKFNEIDGGVKRAVDEAFGDRVYWPMVTNRRQKKKVWCVRV